MDRKTVKPHKNRIRTIILSLLLSAVVWGVITATTNPSMETTLTNVNIKFIGEQVLRDRGLTIVGIDDIPPISAVIHGTRGDLMSYMDDIYVEVDVSSLTSMGQYNLTGKITVPTTRITVEREETEDIPVTIDPIVSKNVELKVRQTGTIRNKLVKSVAETQFVTISGAESEINKVESAIATVDISAVKSENKTRVSYVLTGASGSLLTGMKTIESPKADVEITNTVYDTKTLRVEPVLAGEMERLYTLDRDNTTVTPSTVTVGVRDKDYDVVKLIIDKEPKDAALDYTLLEEEGMYIPEESKTVQAKPALMSKDPAMPGEGGQPNG